jgi:hypothetical protein
VGFSYVSGARDIWDWHEDNLNLDDEGSGVPVGISYRYASLFKSGLRLDMAIGPIVLILGDIEYHDVPIQMSVGYSFAQNSNVRPYARLGASFHINDGDYVKERDTVGAIGAIGLEIGDPYRASFFIEAAYDSAEALFDTSESNSYSTRNESEEEILVNNFLLTVGVKF